ncbi:unnamed protein product (macronuclear) [Paramecium tetraurelia]|uniref:Uncharacterized protein n=1 Tax=Paramecium tetraurelia TaxID=5888 RepID=A0CFA0_PARTE|nr:uncharacterized protein GSPATT00037906001 [Paramecium tetraurelia]CAK69467.1 unnamed protein product [Paramecium tetraurelia]|eukprot:XP_001436864.1 hypothetical protein (macronuclear) [Paramecium tetraurelia strain d4-2]
MKLKKKQADINQLYNTKNQDKVERKKQIIQQCQQIQQNLQMSEEKMFNKELNKSNSYYRVDKTSIAQKDKTHIPPYLKQDNDCSKSTISEEILKERLLTDFLNININQQNYQREK